MPDHEVTTIDCTPNYARVFDAFVEADLDYHGRRLRKESPLHALRAGRKYFPVLSVCFEAALGAQQQGDGGEALRKFSRHLEKVGMDFIEALRAVDPDAT